MEKITKQDTTCCDNQRIMVDESLSFECYFEDGVLIVDTTDNCTEGFDNYRCINCDKRFEPEQVEIQS